MANEARVSFLKELTERCGSLRKLSGSQSLYELGDGNARVYIRYSRVHSRNQTFYGLRRQDLQRLEGHPSFLWDDQSEPLLIPFSDYEDVFQSTSPAEDGQYKVQVYPQDDVTELYIAKVGRFNVEGHFGWGELEALIGSNRLRTLPELSHSQIQTIIGAIGKIKGYDIWVPQTDRASLGWASVDHFQCRDALPNRFDQIRNILSEVDVIWIWKGSSDLRALFEVEHSTPIYSALLRFNDIHLSIPNLGTRFSIVAKDTRRALFVRQLSRPTFQISGLGKLCNFLEYINVYEWYNRVKGRKTTQVNH